jgi:hypothetical protein
LEAASAGPERAEIGIAEVKDGPALRQADCADNIVIGGQFGCAERHDFNLRIRCKPLCDRGNGVGRSEMQVVVRAVGCLSQHVGTGGGGARCLLAGVRFDREHPCRESHSRRLQALADDAINVAHSFLCKGR